MSKNTTDELREALERIWGGGIDYALSPDFKELSDDEKDALYIRYRDTLIERAEQLISNREKLARIDELESFTGHSNEIPDSEVRARIATLRKELDGGSGET